MTFQRATALRSSALVRALTPASTIVAGGYDPSLAPEAYDDRAGRRLHRPRRRRAHVPRTAARARNGGRGSTRSPGLSYPRRRRGSRTTRRGRSARLGRRTASRCPNRGARVLDGYTLLGRPVDVVETSRGCTFDCSFCSIIEMRGRNFHTFGFERVLADIADARARGARAIFLVDDNITLDVRRFEALCQAIIDAGFNDIDYIVQAMTSSIAEHGATLAPLMRRAGFRYVFLGIENVARRRPRVPARRARRTRSARAAGRVGNASARRRSTHCTATACSSSAA